MLIPSAWRWWEEAGQGSRRCLPRLSTREISAAAVEAIPVSYGALATAELYEQPAYFLLPGALQDFDLTDVFCARCATAPAGVEPAGPVDSKNG